MKAIVYTKYGPPEALQLLEIAKPVPAHDQVLIQVQAASVNPVEAWRFTMTPILVRLLDGGLTRPKTTSLGTDVAGRVEAVGENVKQFKPGDEVFGVCTGAFAEYVCAAEDRLALKPADLSFEAAAAVPVAGQTALQALRNKGGIRPGHKVLIQGASGGVGTFAVQIAKAHGADVTAICSPPNAETARSIGAGRVIDYTREDFTRNGQRYDLIVAVNGYHPILDYRRALSPAGTCVVVGGSMAQVFQGMLLGPIVSRLGGRKMGFMGITTANQKDLVELQGLLESRKVVPVIDRRYPLDRTPAALRYLGQGHARGKVVIIVGRDGS